MTLNRLRELAWKQNQSVIVFDRQTGGYRVVRGFNSSATVVPHRRNGRISLTQRDIDELRKMAEV